MKKEVDLTEVFDLRMKTSTQLFAGIYLHIYYLKFMTYILMIKMPQSNYPL